MSDELDRENSEHAAAVMEALCPSDQDRRLVLEQLLRSIAVADSVGPQSWAVTLFDNGFRLNVGSVEAFTFFDGEVRLFLYGSYPSEVQELGEVIPCTLKSAPQPSQVFVGSLSALSKVGQLLATPHEAYVRGSAVTQGGKPRRTTFARYHSPGLYAYATKLVGASAGEGV